MPQLTYWQTELTLEPQRGQLPYGVDCLTQNVALRLIVRQVRNESDVDTGEK